MIDHEIFNHFRILLNFGLKALRKMQFWRSVDNNHSQLTVLNIPIAIDAGIVC